MPALRTTAILCSLVLLAGCLELEQSVTFEDDASGTVEVVTVVDKTAIPQGMGEMSPDGPSPETKTERLEGLDGITDVVVEEEETEERLTETVRFAFRDPESLHDAFQSGEIYSSGDDDDDPSEDMAIQVERLDSGNVSYHQVIEPAGEENQSEEQQAAMQQMVARMLGDSTTTFSLQGSEIVSADELGEISDDGRTVTWELRLADLMTAEEPTVLEAEVSP